MPPAVPTRVFDAARLAAVRSTGLLDTGAEPPFDRLATLAATLLDAPSAFITIVDDRRSFWKACIGVDATATQARQNPVAESFCQYVIGSQEPLIVGDTTRDQRTRENPSISSMGVKAWAGFPLFAPGGEVLGTLCVVDTRQRDWSPREVEVLRTLSLAAASEVGLRVALEDQRRARNAATEALARAEMLLSASTETDFTMDPAAVLEALAAAVVPGLADWCAVHIVTRSGTPYLAAVSHAKPFKAALVRALDCDPLAGSGGPAAVISTGEPELHQEMPPRAVAVTHLGPEHARRLDGLWPHSTLILPLRVRGTVLGAITLVFSESTRTYTEEFVALATMFAAQAATAYENARLYGERAEVAHTLQASLLPRELPDVPGMELAAAFRPCGPAHEVGGDFYDVFPTSTEACAFIIGDVMGKGARAAAMTARVRLAAEAASLRAENPAADMALINRLFARRCAPGEFCTAIYGWFHPTADGVKVSLVNAGHPPPLLLHRSGELEEIAAHGPLLGPTTDPVFPQTDLTLRTGDVLVLYTDGVTELRNLDPADSDAALRQLIKQSVGLLAGELVNRIEQHTLKLSNGEPRDDIAILALAAL